MHSVTHPKDLVERVATFLRAQHPSKTADCVAANTGCSRGQVLKWLELSSAPGGWAMVRLTKAYGPGFLAAVMGELAPDWLDDARRAERLRELEVERERVDRELRALSAR
jgi:hypothetical protein